MALVGSALGVAALAQPDAGDVFAGCLNEESAGLKRVAVGFEPANACSLQELQITWDRAGPAFEGRMDLLGYTCSAGASEDGWSVAVLTNRFNIEDFLTWTEGPQDDPTELVGELLTHVAAEA